MCPLCQLEEGVGGERMRHDNRGVSLVEVMVVVAIMAVVGGVGIWSINTMSGKPAQQCAQKIVYSLEHHRTTAMARVDAKYRLYENGGKIYVDEYWTNDETGIDPSAPPATSTEIGSSGVKVQYTLGADATRHDLPLELAFDRSSGAFKKQSGGDYCTQIFVMRGGREYSVTLVPLTGKVYIK